MLMVGRTPKPANCKVCAAPSCRVRRGMCHNCYHAWLRAGKPDRGAWEPRRQEWLSEGPRRECVACGRGRGNGDFRFGLDFACYCSWHRAGRPDLQAWLPKRRAWLKDHGAIVVPAKPFALKGAHVSIAVGAHARSLERPEWRPVPVLPLSERPCCREPTKGDAPGLCLLPSEPRLPSNDRSAWQRSFGQRPSRTPALLPALSLR